MNDLVSSFIMIVITAVVVAAIFFFTHRAKKQNQAAIQEMAARHGWQYSAISERMAWGSRLNGDRWELVARSEHVGQPGDSGSANIDSETIWKSPWTTPPVFNLLIGPRLSDSPVGLFIPSAYAGMREVEIGIPELSRRYVALGEGLDDLDFLRISTIPRQLIEWPEKNRPLIRIDRDSLEIKFNNYRMDKPDEFERVVMLGESFLAALD